MVGGGTGAQGPALGYAHRSSDVPWEELARMIHEHVYCNRRFAALSRETSFVKRISFRSRAFHVSHLLPALHASRDTLHSLLRFTRNTVSGNFVTNRHESCWLGGGWVHEFPFERARCRDEQATGQADNEGNNLAQIFHCCSLCLLLGIIRIISVLSLIYFSPRIPQPRRQVNHRLRTRHMTHPTCHKVPVPLKLKLWARTSIR